ARAWVMAGRGGVELSSISALGLGVIEVATADLPRIIANYQADPQVVSAEEDKTRGSQAFSADRLYQNQWSLPKMGWNLAFGNVKPTGAAVVAGARTPRDWAAPPLARDSVA